MPKRTDHLDAGKGMLSHPTTHWAEFAARLLNSPAANERFELARENRERLNTLYNGPTMQDAIRYFRTRFQAPGVWLTPHSSKTNAAQRYDA